MSSKSITVDLLDVLSRYAAGYFPLYDQSNRFYWERLSIRAVLPVNAQTRVRARRMSRRVRERFAIRYTTDVAQVIAILRQEEVKPNSWVREEVVAIYRALHAAGLLQTIEAYDGEGRLVGGLLGIVMPGIFIAETMFSLVPDASKVCLCRLIEDAYESGVKMIDVQTPHDLDEFGLPRELDGHSPHPCIRLGEKSMRIAAFMRAFRGAWKKSFDGGVAEWLAISVALQAVARRPGADAQLPAGVSEQAAAQARGFLRHTLAGT